MAPFSIDREAFNSVCIVLSIINVFFHGFGISLLVKLWKKTSQQAQQLMIINLSAAELINSLFRIIVLSCHMLPEKYFPRFRPPPGGMGGFPPRGGMGGAAGNLTGSLTGNLTGSLTGNLTAGNLTGAAGNLTGGPPRGRPPMVFPPMTDAQLTSHYFTMFGMTAMYCIVYLIMLALTIDRLLIVVLKSYYNKLCSLLNVKILLAIIWVIGIIMLIAIPLAYHVHDYDHRFHFEYTIYLVTDVIFMVAAIISYAGVFLFYRGYEVHVQSNDNPEGDADTSESKNTSSSKSGARQWSIVRTLLDPYFYIPLLIIITYFFFVVLPHWIYIGKKYGTEEEGDHMEPFFAMLVLLLLGYWSDAIVYIFLQPPVRKLLWRWLRCKKSNWNDGNTVSPVFPPPPVDSSPNKGVFSIQE